MDGVHDLVRSDSVTADMVKLWMVIILSQIMGFNLTTAYIKGASIHSGPITIELYVLTTSPDDII